MTIHQRMAGRSRNGIRAGTRNTRPELEAIYENTVAAGRRRTRKEDGAFRPSHPDFSESRDRRQSRHHDPHLFLQEAGGDAGAELDHRAAGGVAGNPQASAFSYMDFLGPAGFGTPDDVEAIEAAQRGYKGAEDYGGWNDISAGVAPEGPDELRQARRRGPDAGVLDQVAGISVELAPDNQRHADATKTHSRRPRHRSRRQRDARRRRSIARSRKTSSAAR